MSRIRRESFAMKHMIHNDDENEYGSPDRMFSSKKLEPIKIIQNKSQKKISGNSKGDQSSSISSSISKEDSNNEDYMMHGRVSETLHAIKRDSKKSSWWDLVRFWVTSGVFGKKATTNNDTDNNVRKGYHSKGKKKASGINDIDFDDEGRKILASKLGFMGGIPSPSDKGGNDYDALYRSPKGEGIIYVGNDRVAKNKQVLRKLGISRIINCTHGDSQLPNYHQPSTEFIYMNFQICYWEHETKGEDDKLLKFFNNVFNFIDVAINDGKNVLIHCLAGAHRAGATAIACLMHYTDMNVQAAITAAKICRPIIDPISHLATLINSYGRARSNRAIRRITPSTLMSMTSVASSSSPNVLNTIGNDMGFLSKSFAHESYKEKSSNKKKNLRRTRYTYDASPINKNNITTLVPLVGSTPILMNTTNEIVTNAKLSTEMSKHGRLRDELSPDNLNKRRLARNKRQSF